MAEQKEDVKKKDNKDKVLEEKKDNNKNDTNKIVKKKEEAKSNAPNLAIFEAEANYKTLVCGQHKDLVTWCRKVLKFPNDSDKQTALQQFKDAMIAKLQQDCDATYTVGVSIGSPMKDTIVLIKKDDQIIVKLIMDPLPIDCKQRTFVTQSVSKSKQDAIFKALYKFVPTQ